MLESCCDGFARGEAEAGLTVFMVWWQAQFSGGEKQEVAARPCSIASNNWQPAGQESKRKSKRLKNKR